MKRTLALWALSTGCNKAPSALSEPCRELVYGFSEEEQEPTSESELPLVMQACPELLPYRSCRTTASNLRNAAPEDVNRILSPCWDDFCPEGFAAYLDANIASVDRLPVFRDTCNLSNSGLVTDAEFHARFDSSITDPDAAWRSRIDWNNEAHMAVMEAYERRAEPHTWINAEILYSRSSALPEADRERLRRVLRAWVLAPWEPPPTEPLESSD